ncbi:MAG: hypothetical protein ACI9N9_001081 [Enterobacterales bacterium]|jgi:hypothetical protein
MAISGIGSQTITQFPPRTATSGEKNLKKEADVSVALNNTGKTTETTTTLFKSVNNSSAVNQSTDSRSDLSNIETNRKRFQLQTESKKPEGKSSKAIQSFSDVANFERKDELNSTFGIDIFI